VKRELQVILSGRTQPGVLRVGNRGALLESGFTLRRAAWFWVRVFGVAEADLPMHAVFWWKGPRTERGPGEEERLSAQAPSRRGLSLRTKSGHRGLRSPPIMGDDPS
jgi:hypothetical protein